MCHWKMIIMTVLKLFWFYLRENTEVETLKSWKSWIFMNEFQWLYSFFLLHCQYIMELNLYCARIALTFEKKTTALSWLFVGQACDSWWLVTPRPWPGLRLTLTLARCESTGERWAGPGGPWVLTPGRGPGARPGPGRGRGRAWSGPGHGGRREAGRRGTEDTRTLGPGPLTRVRVRRDLSEPRIEPETSGEWPHSDSGLGWAPRLSQ